MDLLLPMLLLIAAAFCWLLAVGEGRDGAGGGLRLRSGGRRYRYSPMRAVTPALLAAAALSFGFEAARADASLRIAALAIVTGLGAAAVALARYRASVDYVPERGLRISAWSGRRAIAFADIAAATFIPGGGWRPDNYRARLRLTLRDGSVITLNEQLRGFVDLVQRVAAECPEGLVETRAR